MSQTAFTLVNKLLPYPSWIAPDLDEQMLRDGYAKRVADAAKQAQDTTSPDTQIVETIVEDNPTSIGSGSNFSSIIDFPDLAQVSQAKPQVSFHALQEWEGYVLEEPAWADCSEGSREEEFTARLLDLTAGSSQEEEEAVIPLTEIAEDDLNRLRPGAIFRWVIGYARSASGTKQRVSQIVFRDLPAMTRQDISEGEEWARKIAQSIVD